MKTDISNREDIEFLVNAFYKKVEKNDTIGFIFTKIAKVNWEHHLPKMYDFWESILFGSAIYKGNPMLTHFDINAKINLKETEFTAWKTLFFNTVDEYFEGNNANLIKQKAQSIADLMFFKLNAAPSKTKIV
ncbi:group III truncated hemoglobin [Pedobacter sp. MW01-1-1]|uniref:group III truncated hemoglobin n=1 Tax=Pedobacter sp. MW01-1-1 TaxID=3383027 RepID=UPI003FF0CBAD